MVTTLGTCAVGQRASTFASQLAFTLGLLLLTVSTALAQTTVTAQWDRNTDSQTAGYRLLYGTSPGSYPWSVDAGNQTNAPIALSPGSVYYFVVRAYDVNVQYGPSSAEASIDLRSGTPTTPPPPPTPTPTPSPSVPTADITASLEGPNTARITWSTANATRATINGSPLNAATGTATVHVTGTTTFTLVATNAAGVSTTRSATVTVGGSGGAPAPPPSSPTPTPTPPPPASGMTAQITASLQTPNTALITWNTANAIRATINGSPLNAANGTATVHITGTTTFALVVTDAAGATLTRSATVTTGSTASGPTAQITAHLQTPNTAIITWHVANATRATINGSPLNAASGTASVHITGTTTFTLVATAANGAVATQSATVSR